MGSQRGDKSNTAHFAEEILDKVAARSKEEVKHEIFTSKNVNIKSCKGCSQCFIKASCNQDKDDHMNMLKKRWLKLIL